MLKAEISTDIIELDVVNGQPLTIAHGVGRQIAGFIVVWRTAPVDLYVQDPARDSSKELILVPTATARVRLVLL